MASYYFEVSASFNGSHLLKLLLYCMIYKILIFQVIRICIQAVES